jgi:hypothetical protein
VAGVSSSGKGLLLPTFSDDLRGEALRGLVTATGPPTSETVRLSAAKSRGVARPSGTV